MLLLPLANLLKGSNGHIVQTTGLPGGAVSGGPLTAAIDDHHGGACT